jgi:hypothetical protein
LTPIVGEDGVTATVATGGASTVRSAVPDCPSLLAVMVACPADTPRTTPEEFTVATLAAEVPHVTAWFETTAPLVKRVVA